MKITQRYLKNTVASGSSSAMALRDKKGCIGRENMSMFDSEQRLITVAGTESKVGATHLTLSLGAKASLRSISCAVILSKASFYSLRQYYHLKVYEEPSQLSPRAQNKSYNQAKSSITADLTEVRQFASINGLSLMSGVLPSDLDGYQLIIWDCGVLPKGSRKFALGDLCCLVSGGQPWELDPLHKLLMEMDASDFLRHAICIRGVSEDGYDHLKSQMRGRLECVNLQHKADWTEVQLREDLLAILRLAGH